MDSKIVSMDLGLRKNIYIRVSSYHPNDQNEIRRAYKGHFQPLSQPQIPAKEYWWGCFSI